MKTTKLKEQFRIEDQVNENNYVIILEIDYHYRTWTISGPNSNDKFIFKNTRNYYAGMVVSNLIRLATQMAKDKLCLTDQEIKDYPPF